MEAYFSHGLSAIQRQNDLRQPYFQNDALGNFAAPECQNQLKFPPYNPDAAAAAAAANFSLFPRANDGAFRSPQFPSFPSAVVESPENDLISKLGDLQNDFFGQSGQDKQGLQAFRRTAAIAFHNHYPWMSIVGEFFSRSFF